jgi:predicted transcriptional regulator
MSTFKEQLEELNRHKRKLAIWEAIHQLVDDKFITKDGRKAGGIKEPTTGEVVSEEEIEDVLESIVTGPITEIKQSIEEIENRNVVVLSPKVADEEEN